MPKHDHAVYKFRVPGFLGPVFVDLTRDPDHGAAFTHPRYTVTFGETSYWTRQGVGTVPGSFPAIGVDAALHVLAEVASTAGFVALVAWADNRIDLRDWLREYPGDWDRARREHARQGF